MLITFVEGDKIGWYKNGKKELFESQYVKRFQENAKSNKKAKKQYYAQAEESKNVELLLDYALPCKDGKRCLYAVSTREGYSGKSFLFYKDLEGATKEETLFASNTIYQFKTLTESKDGEIYATLQAYSNGFGARIGKVSKEGKTEAFDYAATYDENPTWNMDGALICNSYDREIKPGEHKYSFTLSRFRRQAFDKKKPYYAEFGPYGQSCIKPLYDKDGNFYYIHKAEKPKKNGFIRRLWTDSVYDWNRLLDFLFSNRHYKKDRDVDIRARNGLVLKKGKKMWINNTLVDIKKTAKENKKYEDLGVAPAEWELVQEKRGTKKVLAYGVADFDIAYENGKTKIVYTNGKKVFALMDGEFGVEREILFETERCVKLATLK